MIETVKYDGGVTGDYMRLMEDEEYLRECAMQEGREEGREEGRQEGILLATRQNVVDLLKEYVSISEELVARIHAEGDLSILKTWLQYAAKSTSPEEFLEKIEQN